MSWSSECASRISGIGNAARSYRNKGKASGGLRVKAHGAGTAAGIQPVRLYKKLSAVEDDIGVRAIQRRKVVEKSRGTVAVPNLKLHKSPFSPVVSI